MSRRLPATVSVGAVVLTAVVVGDAATLRAQSSAATAHARVFVGVGGGVTNNETGLPRTEDEWVYGTESLFMTWVEGGFFVTRRLALGVEWVQLGTADAPAGSSRNQLAEQYTESAVLITARMRIEPRRHVAIEPIVAAGPLFARRVTTTRARVGRQVFSEEDTVAKAVMLGADIAIAMSAHFALVPTARVYRLLRPEPLRSFSRNQAFTQVTAGVSGRLAW